MSGMLTVFLMLCCFVFVSVYNVAQIKCKYLVQLKFKY